MKIQCPAAPTAIVFPAFNGSQVHEFYMRTAMVAQVYNTSTGRLLMAYLSPKQLEHLLKSIGLPMKKAWPGHRNKTRPGKGIKKIRQEAFVQITSVHHTIGFAVPVFKNGEVLAGLSVFIPESRYTKAAKNKIFRLIRKTAKNIESKMEDGSG